VRSLHTLVFAGALLLAACSATAPSPRLDGTDTAPCSGGRQRMTRIELYFGLSRPGGTVSDAEFRAFVDSQVTPRFPDGLTVLAGSGQWRDARGVLHVEGSKLLIVMVAANEAQVDAKIEAIRDEYRRRFEQQSVLRADGSACVSF
jgi:hypothetical protein